MFGKVFFVVMLMCCNTLNLFCESEYPKTLHLIHDKDQRLFHISTDNGPLGTIVNSDYGVLDFYDSEDNKLCVNVKDELFDNDGKSLGTAWVVSDHERNSSCWLLQSNDVCGSTRIDIQRVENLFYLQFEGSGLVYRDAETNDPLAVCLMDDLLIEKGYIFNSYVKKWTIMTIDTPRLQEKNISYVYLVWALMKHIQKTLNGPYEGLPYVDNYPNNGAS